MRRVGFHVRRLLMVASASASVACGVAPREPSARGADTTRAAPPVNAVGLMAPLQTALKSELPDAALMTVVDIEFVGWMEARDDYLLLVQVDRGVETDPERPFESFCIVGVDEALASVRGIVDCFPSRRRGDYSVRFEAVTFDSIIVLGRGATYGDQEARFAFPLTGVRR